MSSSQCPAEDLATDILDANPDISPLFEEVVTHIERLRESGIDDTTMHKTIPAMYRRKQSAADEGSLTPPPADEIRVISLPRQYQRPDWA